jgi:transmembrane sensor
VGTPPERRHYDMKTDRPTMDHDSEDGPDAAAAGWVARLQGDQAGESDWLAFESWLEESPSHAPAYDRALALWHELDRHAPALKRRLAAPPARPRWPLLAGGALAAALALGWVLHSAGPTGPAVELYRTLAGERKTAALADGSHIELDGASVLSVSLSAAERRVAMQEGEAIFDVAHDADRPFVITVGDRRIRVVGTEFDVRRRGDDLSVTVRRGIVEVTPLDGSGQGVRLIAGDRVEHRIGTAIMRTSTVSPDDSFAWRSGRLIYRDRPLSEVIADLTAQFAKPVAAADDKTAQMRFSGVLVLDDEEKVVQRLTLLAPLWSSSGPEGIVVGAKQATAR